MDMSDFMWGVVTASAGWLTLGGAVQLGKLVIKSHLHSHQRAPKDRDLVSIVNLAGAVQPGTENCINIHEIRRQVEKAVDNKAKGLILRISSPGGYMPTSDLVREYIENINDYIHAYKTGKKSARAAREEKRSAPLRTVAYIDSLAASGGYHIASAADKICIAPKAITGSIGVFMFIPDVTGLAKRHGVEPYFFKRGKYKATGSPFLEMDEEAKAFLEARVEEVYQAFIEDVARGRGLKKEEVEPYAHGGILSAQQALDAKLVDKIGYFKDAINMFRDPELGGLNDPVARPAEPHAYIAIRTGVSAQRFGEGIGRGLARETKETLTQPYLI